MNPLLLSLIVLALAVAALMLARLRRRRKRKADATATAPFATCIAACPVCKAHKDCEPPASEIES